MRIKSWIVAVAVLALAGCTAEQRADVRAYCDRNPAICILAGAVVIGGVVGIVAATEPDSPHPQPIKQISDKRLKVDIHPLQTLNNGIKLYAYRYRGDDRIFVGPLAQDLLADPRFRGAVSVDAKGYYRVDMTALDLEVVNATAMTAAGDRAELLANPAH